MQYYPLCLNLGHKQILVVGGGGVGMRKIKSLLTYLPQSITIIDPNLDMQNSFFTHPLLLPHKRPFVPEDVLHKHLVFATTNNATVNSIIARECEAKGILCNIADAPEKSDFIVPASITQGSIQLTVSTQGTSPALARFLREELEAWLGNRYTALVLVLERVRPLVLKMGNETTKNTKIFRHIVASPLAQYLENKEFALAAELLEQLLPQQLHCYIGELLHEL